jgi:hypothetical protein
LDGAGAAFVAGAGAAFLAGAGAAFLAGADAAFLAGADAAFFAGTAAFFVGADCFGAGFFAVAMTRVTSVGRSDRAMLPARRTVRVQTATLAVPPIRRVALR